MSDRDVEVCLQATLVKSCRAKLWICELGNGTNPFPLRKSKTLCPRRSVTMQIWFRKSKESLRCMHLFRFVLSFSDNVERTRSSMRDASRYFCTERIILTAHFVFFFLSKASTTFPKVPWPRSRTMESASASADGELERHVTLLTSLCQIGIWSDDIMTVFVIDFLMLGEKLRGISSCRTGR